MDRDSELAVIRRAYAKQILAKAGVDDPRVENAFADIRREDFLGPGPWPGVGWGDDYVPTPSADPVYLYTDNVFGILPTRHINNGQPSGHARWISSAQVAEGDGVVHVGAGTGYYTAILAHLAGTSGRVTAVELDPEMASRARANLAAFGNVRVIEGDGAVAGFDEEADVIYVNAGVTRPADAWLDGLADGGRLILPLTSNYGFRDNAAAIPIERRGAVFHIERRASEWLARWVSPVAIVPCGSARDAESEAALSEAFGNGRWKEVRRLYRTDEVPKVRCWLLAPGWCLAYA